MSDVRDRDRSKRPEWRELDRRKDKSSHVDGGGPKRNLDERKVTTGYHRYKQDLDSLFSTGEASSLVKNVLDKSQVKDARASETPAARDKSDRLPERQKLLREIRAASSSREITRLVDAFLEKWELPDDIEILIQVLEHEDEQVQAEALEGISHWLDGHVLKHRNVLTSRVRALASRSDDERVRTLARQVNRKL